MGTTTHIGKAALPEPAPGSAAPSEYLAPTSPVPIPLDTEAADLRRTAQDVDPLGGAAIPAPVLGALRRRSGGGSPLADDVADAMGGALGADFSDVRVHADAEAADLSSSLHAEAFTYGNDIYFGTDGYDTSSQAGQHVLAHELSHVAQQRSGADTSSGVIGRADDPVEAAADRAADEAIASVQRTASGPNAQRHGQLERDQGSSVRRTPSIRRAGVKDLIAMFQGTGGGGGGGGGAGGAPSGGATGGGSTGGVTPTVGDTGGTSTGGTPTSGGPVTTGGTPTTGGAPTTGGTTPAPQQDKPTTRRDFEDAIGKGPAPADVGEGRTRLGTLKAIIEKLPSDAKHQIGADVLLMKKAIRFVGPITGMSLITALDINVDKTHTLDGDNKPSGPQAPKKHHLSGAEADKFIAENMGDYPHLVPYLQQAIDNGQGGEGSVASVPDWLWQIAYEAQYPGETVGQDDWDTNAFIGNKNPDRPALLHHDRGTPSTAIHESMHQYTMNRNVLNTFGAGLNEGLTEYFTRKLTDRNAQPAKLGGPERDNYESNIEFLRDIISIFGGDLVSRETTMAEIYFNGDTALFEQKARAKLKAENPTASDAEIDTKWADLSTEIEDQNWDDAYDMLFP